MSFEKLNSSNLVDESTRSCVIIHNLMGKELKLVKNYLNLFGVRDQILLNHSNGNAIVEDVIKSSSIANISNDCEEGFKEKAIIFNNISPNKLNLFLDALKKSRIKRPLIAMVTDTSKTWSINTLVANLMEERKTLNEGRESAH